MKTSFSPFDFGAVGDGIADDTAAVQAAADAAIGGALLLSGGAFKLSQVYIANGVREVSGRGLVKLDGSANAGIILRGQGITGAPGSEVRGVQILGLEIDAGGSDNAANVIWGANAQRVRVEGLRVHNLRRGYGILLRNYAVTAAGGGHVVINNEIDAAPRNVPGGAPDLYGIAVDAEPICGPVDSRGGTVAAATERWRTLFLPPDGVNAGNTISGNRINGGYYGLSLAGLAQSLVTNNRLSGNARGISLQNGARGNSVSANLILDCLSSGIHLAFGASDNLVAGNKIATQCGVGESLLQAYVGCNANRFLHNDLFSSGQQAAVYIAVMSNRNLVQGNSIAGVYKRVGIGVESAWNTGLSERWHYGAGADTNHVDWMANAAMVDNVICDNVMQGQTIVLGQVRTAPGGHSGYTTAFDALLTGTIVRGNLRGETVARRSTVQDLAFSS